MTCTNCNDNDRACSICRKQDEPVNFEINPNERTTMEEILPEGEVATEVVAEPVAESVEPSAEVAE